MNYATFYHIIYKKAFVGMLHIQSKCWESWKEMTKQTEILWMISWQVD